MEHLHGHPHHFRYPGELSGHASAVRRWRPVWLWPQLLLVQRPAIAAWLCGSYAVDLHAQSQHRLASGVLQPPGHTDCGYLQPARLTARDAVLRVRRDRFGYSERELLACPL